jgi:hypothetical protein
LGRQSPEQLWASADTILGRPVTKGVEACMQDAFLPGVTRRTVAEALERRFGASGGSTFRGRDLAGWYLQQVRLPAFSRHRLLCAGLQSFVIKLSLHRVHIRSHEQRVQSFDAELSAANDDCLSAAAVHQAGGGVGAAGAQHPLPGVGRGHDPAAAAAAVPHAPAAPGAGRPRAGAQLAPPSSTASAAPREACRASRAPAGPQCQDQTEQCQQRRQVALEV